MSGPLISVEKLTFSYASIPVIRNISFDIRTGEYIFLTGESGCGKSTLLQLLAKLEVPTAGEVRFYNEPYSTIPSPILRRRVGYLQQLPVMIEGSIRDNLFLSLRFSSNRADPPSEADLNMLLHRAKLPGVDLNASADALSVGQKQRIALVRLLLMNPDVLLLDEPTASLDADSSGIIHDWLRELHQNQGRTILHVSHAKPPAAGSALRNWNMKDGTLFENDR